MNDTVDNCPKKLSGIRSDQKSSSSLPGSGSTLNCPAWISLICASCRLAGEKHGFAVERQAGGVPTAFVARRAAGPILSSDSPASMMPCRVSETRRRETRRNRQVADMLAAQPIGPANAGAAIIAAALCEKLASQERSRHIGCPAEEILWGKIALLKAGVFDGIDVILTSHGGYQTGALSGPASRSHPRVRFSMEKLAMAVSRGTRMRSSLPSRSLLPREDLRGNVPRSSTAARASPRRPSCHRLRRPRPGPGSPRVAMISKQPECLCRHCCSCGEDCPGRRCRVPEQFISETRGYLPNDTLGKTLFEVIHPWSTAMVEV